MSTKLVVVLRPLPVTLASGFVEIRELLSSGAKWPVEVKMK